MSTLLVTWHEPEGRLTVDVALEDGASARKENIRCGASVCDVKARQGRDALEVLIWARIGPPVWVTLAAALPAPPQAAEIDGQGGLVPHCMPDGAGVRAILSYQAGAETELRLIR